MLAVAGLLVWLFVLNRHESKGKVVPAVVGMQQQQAIARLTGEGFDVRAIVGPAPRPAGIVASQKPGGGSRLDKGQTVVIAVSNGHRAATATTPTAASTTGATTPATTPATTTGTTTAAAAQSVQVPDATGQDAASGAGQVEAAGFVAETEPVGGAGAPGSIVQQDPPGASQADVGSVVRLSVATGSSRPPQPVPDVTGRKAGAARAALLGAKLTVRTEYRKGPSKSTGVVLSQAPASGSLPAYTQVTIVVGS